MGTERGVSLYKVNSYYYMRTQWTYYGLAIIPVVRGQKYPKFMCFFFT